ncbi:MAG: MMPL family transporter [Polyangiaceae bacterium]
MILALARWLSRDFVARVILAVTLALTAVGVVFAVRVKQDDNVLEFLPKDSAEVKSFYEVSDRFGSLDVALVGVASSDVFAPDFLERLLKATEQLNHASGVAYALTLTNVDDYSVDKAKGVVETGHMISEVPKGADEIEKLRLHATKNVNVVGNLVAKDSKGVVLYCFLRRGIDPHIGAKEVRDIVNANFPSEEKYWGGSPFISTYIYDVTQKDLKKLAPWACVAIIVLILLSFRDWKGLIIALASTGIGIGLTLGVMGVLGVKSNIVLGSMPVILFALGSAPPVHILTRYYFHRNRLQEEQPDGDPAAINADALVEAMRDKGLVVIASAATVIAGLGSFITMDIAPMRVFGIFTSLGIVFTLLMAVLFVPAAIRVFRLKGKPTTESAILGRATAWLAGLARKQKAAMGLALLAIAGVCAFGIDKVDTRMDNQSFFDPGSEPDRADKFMRERFGGSLFVQVWVKGDMTDPYTLREVQRVADRISGLPRVASVQHIGQVLSAANDAIMDHVLLIPDTAWKISQLYPFVSDNRAVSQLVAEDRASAIINVKLAVVDIDGVDAALKDIEDAVKDETVTSFVLADPTGPRADEAKAYRDRAAYLHMLAELRRVNPAVDEHAEDLKAFFELADADVPLDAGLMESKLKTFFLSEEFAGDFPESPEKPKPVLAAAVAKSVSTLPLGVAEPAVKEAVGKGLGLPVTDESVEDVTHYLMAELRDLQAEISRDGRTDGFLKAAGIAPDDPDRAQLAKIASVALASMPKVALPAGDEKADGSVSATVTGLPVLYRGLSQSVEKNQIWSLLSAVVLVAITMTIAFRSIASGILSAIPALFTIIAVYGGMGLAKIHLDIGTSMLASLIIGAGVDYAIHYLGAWRPRHLRPGTRGRATPRTLDEAAENAADVSGPGIWTNALMVAAGFFVLTLGEARPLKHVGTLTAVAMVVASLSTFLLVPIFAKKHEYVAGSASTTKGRSPNR